MGTAIPTTDPTDEHAWTDTLLRGLLQAAIGSFPLGYKAITLSGTAKGLDDTTAIPTGATVAIVVVSGANIRTRDDGSDPTASVGMPWAAGKILTIDTSPLSNVRFIGTGATLDVAFYK